MIHHKFDRRTQWTPWDLHRENLEFLEKYRLKFLYYKMLAWYGWFTHYGRFLVGYVWKLTNLDKKYYVKVFDSRRNIDADIATTRLIRSQTTIPVPLGLLQFRTLHSRYLVMERISGVSLDRVMMDLTTEDRSRIIAELRHYMHQLRSIQRPHSDDPAKIASVAGGPIYCTRLHLNFEMSGPFRDEAHMNSQIRCGKPVDDFPEPVPTVHRTHHPLVLTHNDFAPYNIMVVDNPDVGWQVSAIIDWECAGWLPNYWEYVKTLHVSSRNSLETRRSFIRDWLPEILEPFKLEAEADWVFDKYPTSHIR